MPKINSLFPPFPCSHTGLPYLNTEAGNFPLNSLRNSIRSTFHSGEHSKKFVKRTETLFIWNMFCYTAASTMSGPRTAKKSGHGNYGT